MGKFSRGAKTNYSYMIYDFIFGVLGTIVALLISGEKIFEYSNKLLVLGIVFTILCIFINKSSKLYNVTLFFYTDRIIKYITKNYFSAVIITSVLIFYVGEKNIGVRYFVIFLIVEYIMFIISAFFERYMLKRFRSNSARVLLVGEIDKYRKFRSYIDKSNINLNVVGYVSLNPQITDGYLGNISEVEKLIRENSIDAIYVMERKNVIKDIEPYTDMCMEMGITVNIIKESYRKLHAHSYVSSIGTYPVITYHKVTLNKIYLFIKRIIDIIGSIIGIIGFSPVMLITAIAIKLNDKEGPVIFKQERVGQNGRHFYIFKFRTMCANAEKLKEELMKYNKIDDGLMFKMENDPRITKVGKFLRKTSIDELPQFFNVLMGEMSLVGTRPPTIDEVEKYKRNHWRRISIKPGITGMWQVSGRSNITDFEKVVELDTEYIDSWSIFLDFKIIIKTVLQIISKDKSAY